MSNKKIVCLGGGSVYFHWGMIDLVTHAELAGSEIVLYDLDAEKIRLVAAMTRRLARYETGQPPAQRGRVSGKGDHLGRLFTGPGTGLLIQPASDPEPAPEQLE